MTTLSRSALAGVSAAALFLLAIAPTQAELLAYEGFDYALGSDNLAGQNGGVGFAGAWQKGGVGGGINEVGVTAPLGFSTNYLNNGNAAFVRTNDGGNYTSLLAARQLSTGLSVAPTTPIYISFLPRLQEPLLKQVPNVYDDCR